MTQQTSQDRGGPSNPHHSEIPYLQNASPSMMELLRGVCDMRHGAPDPGIVPPTQAAPPQLNPIPTSSPSSATEQATVHNVSSPNADEGPREVIAPSSRFAQTPSSVQPNVSELGQQAPVLRMLEGIMRRMEETDRERHAQFHALNRAQHDVHNRINEIQVGRGREHLLRDVRRHDHVNPERQPQHRDTEERDQEIEQLRAAIKAMNTRVHQATSSAPEIDRVLRESQNTPFTERISRTQVRIPEKIRLPNFAGDSDPSQHLTAFSIALGRAHFSPGEKDPGECQLFVETLTGDALTWFSRLETRSIDNYHDLSTAFLRHYSIYIKQGASDTDLWTICQEDDEPLRSYLNRFRAIVSRVSVADRAAIQALRNGLRRSAFKSDLLLNRPQTLEDALHKGSSFADIEEEETALAQKHLRLRASKDKQKEEYREPRQHLDKDYRKPDKNRGPTGCFAVENSDDARDATQNPPPQQSNQWIRKDASKPYCDFHRRYGHSTTECRHLQQYLMMQYQKGEARPSELHGPKLDPAAQPNQQNEQRTSRSEPRKSSTDANPKRARNEHDDEPRQPSSLKRINMIMGGLPTHSDSVRSIREYERKAPPNSCQRVEFEDPSSDSVLHFSDLDMSGLDVPHNDPLVINLHIADCDISRVLIDGGSSVDLIFKSTLERMDVPNSDIKPRLQPLTGFSGETVSSIGTVKLPVYVGRHVKIVKFVVVDRPATYNVIMGTPWIHAMKAVPSTYHQCIKIPTSTGTYTIFGNQRVARGCFAMVIKKRRTQMCNAIATKQATPEQIGEPATEPTEQVVIDDSDPTRTVRIGAHLDPDLRTQMISFLKGNVRTFAWSVSEMVGIDPLITCHELNVDPTYKPVKQKRRKLGHERAQAVEDEVKKLTDAGSIVEVQYPEWLANPVVVKKKNGKWRVCIDFTDLNKACPKDSFPLPHIDRLVEATTGNELLSFMDAFSGYNQILMHPDDREKTAFVTNRGTYCYKVMPFGLKNAGATYQRLVNKMFADQIGQTMEVYIDDMLVKSLKATDHITDLRACFETLNKYDMKLNPAKCTFGVTSGEFLGYIVTNRGIEANPAKIRAIHELPSPTNTREVQRLTGRIAALNRFISRSTDKCLPFYQLLRGNKRFRWTDECEKAFTELKQYLTSNVVLAKPEDGETLYLYAAVTCSAVSGVLVREERGQQRPIFYISKALDDAASRYPVLEKLAFAVVTAARKLRPYFQSHSIVVYTSYPLRTILHSPTQSGRLAKWAVELSEYDIEYKSRTSAKSQVLADFLIELSPEAQPNSSPSETWSLFVDGSSSSHGSGIGVRLVSPTHELLEQSFRLAFDASNNEAEYEALLAGLRLAIALGVQNLQAFVDSQLVANQFNGTYDTRNDRMDAYLQLVQTLAKQIPHFELTKIPRSDNTSADALAALASTSDPALRRVIPVECIEQPSISSPAAINMIEDTLDEGPELNDPDLGRDTNTDPDWTTEINAYLINGVLPEDKWAARRLKLKASRYTRLKGRLYRWSASRALLRCVNQAEAEAIIRETHEGAGGNHSGGRSLAIKVRRHGYFWPTMVADCEKFALACEQCQRHGRMIHVPSEAFRAGATPYPFMRWAMDIVGPLPASRQRRFLLVMTDYFTKWVEAKAYVKIEAADVQNFVWKFVICRHGLPYEIVTDNGSQFISTTFENFCSKWNIRLNKSTPRYPQGNGQAESTNKTILDGLKKRLERKKGLWADELDGVLWSHRTTPRRATGQTPFFLSHGMEALSPAEAGIPGARRTILPTNPQLNTLMLTDQIDQIEEARDQALLRIQNYQNLAAQYYNKRVRGRHFSEGDLVLRKVFENTEEWRAGKLGANWEGPYQVSKVVQPGVYELLTMDGTPIPRSWNSTHLKRYYY